MLNRGEAEQIVKENILPFWQRTADNEYGGYYGEVDFYGKINKTADKGGILNSRILWTFSAAYNLFKDDVYKTYAAQARSFLTSAFLDHEYGGIYWLVDYTGKPLQTRKQFYNLAFAVYALSEHFLATGTQSSLDLAMSVFETLEKYGFDPVQGGYIEACARDWSGIDDFRLSEKDLNCPKSMNTNLHVLEAYTALVRANEKVLASDKAQRVKEALKALLRLTLEKIVSRNWHFDLFFDMDWNPLSKDVSWGHDIEGSWLLYEAALAAGDDNLVSQTKIAALAIADAVHSAAIDHKNGGLLSGCDGAGNIYPKKEWWPQAEAVVGFYNAYELSGEQKYFDAANDIWEYIKVHFMDKANGEWHNELSFDNVPDKNLPKAGFWKCPYHNARACFEIIRRSDS